MNIRVQRPEFAPNTFSVGRVLYHTPEGAPDDIRVCMRDVCEKYGWKWSRDQAEAYNAYIDDVLSQYQSARSRRTPDQLAEEAYELQAAFGTGVDLVNVLTGEKTKT